MDQKVTQESSESSWSENTTPASEDDIEEVVRSPPLVRRSGEIGLSRPRLMRPPIRRRIRAQDYQYRIGATKGHSPSYNLQQVEFERRMDGSESSSPTGFTIITSSTSSCADAWSPLGFIGDVGFVEEEDDEDEDGNWENDDDIEALLVPKLEPEEDDVNMADVKEESMPQTPSVASTPITKRPRGRPRKHPKPSVEDKAKVTKGRSKTGCKTCRRRKKKCDERKPGCELNSLSVSSIHN